MKIKTLKKMFKNLPIQTSKILTKFYQKKKRDKPDMNSLNHVAFIMDGNGRWGQKRNKEEILVISQV